MSDDFQWAIWCYIAEDRTPRNHHCENLKSCKQWYGYGKLTMRIQEKSIENMALASLSLSSPGKSDLEIERLLSEPVRGREKSGETP